MPAAKAAARDDRRLPQDVGEQLDGGRGEDDPAAKCCRALVSRSPDDRTAATPPDTAAAATGTSVNSSGPTEHRPSSRDEERYRAPRRATRQQVPLSSSTRWCRNRLVQVQRHLAQLNRLTICWS